MPANATRTRASPGPGAGAGASINPSGQTATAYSLTSTSKTGNTFTIVKASDGTVTRSCTRTNTKGGCPTSLAW